MLFNTLIFLALQLIAVALNCASVQHKEIFSCQDTCRHPDLSYFQEQDVKNCSNAQEIIFSNSSINVIFIRSVSTEILLLFFLYIKILIIYKQWKNIGTAYKVLSAFSQYPLDVKIYKMESPMFVLLFLLIPRSIKVLPTHLMFLSYLEWKAVTLSYPMTFVTWQTRKSIKSSVSL